VTNKREKRRAKEMKENETTEKEKEKEIASLY
jgi:hypothetical protein